MLFPLLYSIDTNGKIRTWRMEVDGERYRTISGLQDGEKVTSEWTIAKAMNKGKKNATTPSEQAELEVQARYVKQKKTGYFDDVKDINKMTYIEPMLAKSYKDYAGKLNLSVGKWLVQCKFNGMRCVATRHGLFTRKGEKYETVPHIEEALAPLFEQHPDAVFDGELFNNELREQLNEISKLVRRTVHITSAHLAESRRLVKYYVYDGYNIGGVTHSAPYLVRKKQIDKLINEPFKALYLEQVKDITVNSEEGLFSAYQAFVDEGHEGAMLRNADMGYEHKRSKNLLKIKPEDDAEAIIVDITEGTGNWAGTGKRITLRWNGKEFDATFKGSHQEAVQFLADKAKWVGKEVTFLYNGLTGLGTPNYARVDINNCIKK